MIMNSHKYSVVSLFSGAGGFDWGFHRTGKFETQIACEILPEPAATLAHNLKLRPITPDSLGKIEPGERVVINGDVSTVDFSKISIQPDILIGGPPCQDFSITISKKTEPRPGLNGGRGRLYIEFVRAVMFLQPKMFVFENVPGLISANEGAALKTILSDLQHLERRRLEAIDSADAHTVPHYEVDDYKLLFQSIIDGPSVGVPQTRRRLIIVGMRCDLYESLDMHYRETLPQLLKEQIGGKSSLLARFPLTCMEIFEGRSLLHLQEKYKSVMCEYAELAVHPELPAAAVWNEKVWSRLRLDDIRYDYFLANQIEDTPQNQSDYIEAMRLHERILQDLDWLGVPVNSIPSPDGTDKMPRLRDDVVARMQMIPPDENYGFVDQTPWQVVGKDISFIYRRSAPLKPAWTVMAYGGGGTYGYHYERSRAQLTLRERARIQTFSDDFHFQSKKVRAQIGEAVPPLLASTIANATADILQAIDTQKFEMLESANAVSG